MLDDPARAAGPEHPPVSVVVAARDAAGTLPAAVKCYPEYLRDAGYYCTNNAKTDYNFTHDRATWDESSNRAHKEKVTVDRS